MTLHVVKWSGEPFEKHTVTFLCILKDKETTSISGKVLVKINFMSKMENTLTSENKKSNSF